MANRQVKKRDKKYVPASVKAQNDPKPTIHVSMSCGGVKGIRECISTGYSDIRAYKSIDRLSVALSKIGWKLQPVKTNDGVTIFIPICEVCTPILEAHIEKLKTESVLNSETNEAPVKKKRKVVANEPAGDTNE